MAKEIQTKGTVRNLEFRFRRKDGEQRDGLGSAELIEIEGEPCLMAVVADITEHKQIQEQLRESEARLAGIVGSAMDAIIATDSEQNIVLFNTAAEKMFGCATAEAIGTPVERFIPERFRSAHKAHIRRFGESEGASRSLEPRGAYCGASGQVGRNFPLRLLSLIWRQTATSCLPSSSAMSPSATGQMKPCARASRDCAWRFRLEECTRTSGTLRATRSSGPLSTWIFSAQDQPIQTSCRELLNRIHPDDRDQVAAVFARITPENPVSTMRYRFVRSDGTTIWLERSARGSSLTTRAGCKAW